MDQNRRNVLVHGRRTRQWPRHRFVFVNRPDKSEQPPRSRLIRKSLSASYTAVGLSGFPLLLHERVSSFPSSSYNGLLLVLR